MDRVYGVFRPKRGRSKDGWAVMGKRGNLIKCPKLEGIEADNENGSNHINLLSFLSIRGFKIMLD